MIFEPRSDRRLSRRQRRVLELLVAGGEMAGLELVAAAPKLGRGAVYVTLRRLAGKGLVDSRRAAANGHGELPRRLFRATCAATAALAADKARSAGPLLARRGATAGGRQAVTR